MKHLYVIIFWVLVPICTTQAQIINERHLPSQIFIEDDLLYPSQIVLIEKHLFVRDYLSSTGEVGIKIYDVDTKKKIYEFINSGRGPGEYINFDIIRGPGINTLEVSGSTTRKNDIYDVDCLLEKPSKNETYKCIIQSVRNNAGRQGIIIKDSLVANNGFNEDGILNVGVGNKTSQALHPIPNEIKQLYPRLFIASTSLSGNIIVNRDRTKIGFFAEYYDEYKIFEKKEERFEVISERNNSYLPKIDFKVVGNSSAVAPLPETRFGYRTPYPGNKYIYAPFSGKTDADIQPAEDIEWRAFTNTVRIMDWHGTLKEQISIDHQVSSITSNEYEKTFYGIAAAYDKNNQYKASIITFRIK